MAFWPFLNRWWNLPFLVELGLVGAFFALQTLGLGGHGEHEHDLDHDVEVDGDGGSDHDHEAEAEEGPPFVARVPFMVVWLTLFIFGGFSGIFINRVLFVRAQGSYPWWGFPCALLSSLGIGALAVRLAARQIGKLVDTGGRGSARKRELPGSVGVVASAFADCHFGEVRVRGPRGDEMLIHACVAPGEPAISRGEPIVIVDYQEEREMFVITRVPE